MTSQKIDLNAGCPLCGGGPLEHLATIRTSDLARSYEDMLGFSASRFFDGHDEIRLTRCGSCDFSVWLPQIAGDDLLYSHLRKTASYYSKEKDEFGFAAGCIPHDATVLDVGCGEGNFAKYLGDKATYIGIDLTDTSVAAGRAAGRNVSLQTVEDYAAAHPASADAVCVFQVLEHIPNPRSFLEACLRCVKPGGLFVVSVPSADSFLRVAINNILNLPPHHVSWWTDKALRSIASQHGLTIFHFHKELLANDHVEAYGNALLVRGMDAGGRIGLVDRSLRLRVLGKLASLLMPVVRRGLQSQAMRPRGHSTTVVYSVPHEPR